MRITLILMLVAAGPVLSACGESEQEAISRRAAQEQELCVGRYLSAARDGRLGASGQATPENISRWNELCSCAAGRLATTASSEHLINENSMTAGVLQCINSGQ